MYLGADCGMLLPGILPAVRALIHMLYYASVYPPQCEHAPPGRTAAHRWLRHLTQARNVLGSRGIPGTDMCANTAHRHRGGTPGCCHQGCHNKIGDPKRRSQTTQCGTCCAKYCSRECLMTHHMQRGYIIFCGLTDYDGSDAPENAAFVERCVEAFARHLLTHDDVTRLEGGPVDVVLRFVARQALEVDQGRLDDDMPFEMLCMPRIIRAARMATLYIRARQCMLTHSTSSYKNAMVSMASRAIGLLGSRDIVDALLIALHDNGAVDVTDIPERARLNEYLTGPGKAPFWRLHEYMRAVLRFEFLTSAAYETIVAVRRILFRDLPCLTAPSIATSFETALTVRHGQEQTDFGDSRLGYGLLAARLKGAMVCETGESGGSCQWALVREPSFTLVGGLELPELVEMRRIILDQFPGYPAGPVLREPVSLANSPLLQHQLLGLDRQIRCSADILAVVQGGAAGIRATGRRAVLHAAILRYVRRDMPDDLPSRALMGIVRTAAQELELAEDDTIELLAVAACALHVSSPTRDLVWRWALRVRRPLPQTIELIRRRAAVAFRGYWRPLIKDVESTYPSLGLTPQHSESTAFWWVARHLGHLGALVFARDHNDLAGLSWRLSRHDRA